MAVQRTLTYELPNNKQRRMTVGQCTIFDVGKYNVFQRAFGDWMVEQGHEREWSDSDDMDTVGVLRVAGNNRSQALASLRCVEESDDGETWEKVEVPAAWQQVQTFFEDVPFSVLYRWAEVAREVNPGIWMRLTPDEKNAAAANVV